MFSSPMAMFSSPMAIRLLGNQDSKNLKQHDAGC
jgi:hypothetical protein